MKQIVRAKRKKPTFVRLEYHRHKRLAVKWRRPKGHHARRKKLLSYHKGAAPKVGYGVPSKFRDVHPSGYDGIMVYNVADLSKINPKAQAAIIASVGTRNKIEIVEKAVSQKIKILNLRKPEEWLKQNKKQDKPKPTSVKSSQNSASSAIKTHEEGAKK